MIYTLVDMNNKESVGSRFIGRTAKIEFDGNKVYFAELYTSTVQSIIRKGNKLIVQTRNSEYIFEEGEV